MSRKTILIVIALVIVAVGVWVFVSLKKNASTPADGTEQKSFLGSLFPFGSPKPDTTGGVTLPSTGSGGAGTDTGTQNSGQTPTKLVRLSDKLIAGLAAIPVSPSQQIERFDINDNTGQNVAQKKDPLPFVRFVERGTGYIYDIDAGGQNVQKISGTVIARTALASFADGGNTVILRYIKPDNATVATYLGHIIAPSDPTEAGTLKGDFLPENIEDIAVSPDQKSILFLLPIADGVAGMTMKSDGTSKKQTFSNSFSEWLIDWSKAGVSLTTKAASGVSGYSYLVNSSGILAKTLGGVSGLTTKMSPDGKFLLYSASSTDDIHLHMRRVSDGTDTDTGLHTLPEKCTWNAAGSTAYCGAPASVDPGSYPDAWYQGAAHFNDAFWKVDATTGSTVQISNGEGDQIDAISLMLDPAEKYVFFENKTDNSLWSLSL